MHEKRKRMHARKAKRTEKKGKLKQEGWKFLGGKHPYNGRGTANRSILDINQTQTRYATGMGTEYPANFTTKVYIANSGGNS